MIQPDGDGQLQVRLPAFVDDPEAYLREDTRALRQHLLRMDAQAYGMLIWRVLQMDVFTHIELRQPNDGFGNGTNVQVSFEPHPSCPPRVARCVAEGLEENLNTLQHDGLSKFIAHLMGAGAINRERAEEMIGNAYDSAFSFDGLDTLSWRAARAAQESITIREGTTALDKPTGRARRI